MKFEKPLIKATLIKRYKRFLADIELNGGEMLTVHCPNPGAMAGLIQDRNTIWISDSQNPKRKLRYTWELVETNGEIVGINTNRANTIAREALDKGMLAGIGPDCVIKPEQKYGENSRIDFLVEPPGQPNIYVEVKSVTFQRQPMLHEFPDGVTARGAKHLNEMMAEIERGNRAIMLFMVQRNDGDKFAIAEDIDKIYGQTFRQAVKAGLEVMAICCKVSPEQISPIRPVKVLL